MNTGLRARDYILIGLEIVDGILREFQDVGGIVSGSYENIYGFVPNKYKKKSFEALLYRLNKDGYVKKREEGNSKYYDLTDKGKVLARKKGLLLSTDKKWDGRMWVIIFDIEELERNKRDVLRKVIKTFGFTMWQKSVWISTREPSQDFYNYFKDIASAAIFPIPANTIGNFKIFAARVWKIELLSKLYMSWIEKAKFYLDNGEDSGKKKGLLNEFFRIILKDPFLPDEFLPENWIGQEAKKVFLEIILHSTPRSWRQI